MRLAGLLACCALAACMRQTQVGPYVKSVTRDGNWLIVQRCMLQLEGDDIFENKCTKDQVPLASVAPAPAAGPPAK